MNIFDYSIISFLNEFAHSSMIFDEIIHLIAMNKLFKGGVMVTLMWFMWFKENTNQLKVREHILVTLLISIVAIIVGKTLALNLPFRFRPIHEANLNFKLPYGILETAETNNGVLLSSMPSDHAVLYFALATGLYFMSKKVGIFALLYTTMVIAIPRVYLGIHYPSDILVGAIIGIIIAIIGNVYLKNNRIIKIIMKFSLNKPGIFYAVFFLFSYQIADLFTDSYGLVRSIISFF